MRKILFCNVKILMAVVVATVISVLVGCKKDIYDPEKENNGPVFDFSTKSAYTLNLKYDVPVGYKVYFEVYGENPTERDATGKLVKKTGMEPLDKGFTNEKGVYSKPLSIPAYVQKVYVYSPNAGVPALYSAEVNNGVLSDATYEFETAGGSSAKSMLSSRAAGDSYGDQIVGVPGIIKMGRWIHNNHPNVTVFPNAIGLIGNEALVWGRPEFMQYVDKANWGSDAEGQDKIGVSAAILQTINSALPSDNDSKTIDPKLLKSGVVHVKKDATLDLVMLLEECGYLNTLAYYCYPTNNPPTSVPSSQIIALPHAKIIKQHSAYSGNLYYGALFAGEGVRLHYYENGEDRGTTFPAGVSVGWVLYSNAYKGENGSIMMWENDISSDPSLMNGISHLAVFRHGDFVMMGYEDSKKTTQEQKSDYRDLVFHVKASPSDAITDEIPDVKPEEPADVAINHYGMLFYEDIWPFRGDFDMNDVIVKYKSELQMNSDNEIVKSTDTYTVMWSGASFNNSFAIYNENLSKAGDVVITRDGVVVNDVVIDRTNNIVRLANNVLDYANKKEKVVFTITTTFASPIAKEQFVLPPYNPFITVKGDLNNEVHLTNFAPTSYANVKLIGSGHDVSDPAKGLYYITYNEEGLQMPFAIDLSFESEELLNAFQIPMVENKRIDIYFPDFLKWISSQGKEANDWYLRPKK